MIFNVMENKEELLFALKELSDGEVSDISSNLEQYILHVSKTGETMFAWHLIKPLLTQKLRKVSDDFYADMPTDQLPSRPNMENVQYQDLQARVVEHINKFCGTPFTIQRLCELLVNPRSHYTRPDKFLRGIEKIVMVVSTVEAMKVANGSTNSTTAALSDDEGNISDADKSVSGSMGLVNGGWGGPPTPPGPALSPNRPSSPALDLTDKPDRPGPLSPNHPLNTTSSTTHSSAGSDGDMSVAHLRPMGQLEAFVQNVSQRLTNQLNTANTTSMTANGSFSIREDEKESKNVLESDSSEEKAGDEKETPESQSTSVAASTEEGSDVSDDAKASEVKSEEEEEDRCDSSKKIDEDQEEAADEPPIDETKSEAEATTTSDRLGDYEPDNSIDERRDDRKRELPSREDNDSSLSSSTSSSCSIGPEEHGEPPAKHPRLQDSDSCNETSSSTIGSQDEQVSASVEIQPQTSEAAVEEGENVDKDSVDDK